MKNIFYSFIVVFALFLTGCADAGKDQTVNSNALVILDASASTASVGGEVKQYIWKQISGSHVTLTDTHSKETTFTAPTVTTKTRLVFVLTTVEYGGYPHRYMSRDYINIIVDKTLDETDTIAPELILLGDANVTIYQNSNYVDAGAQAFDDKDGNITSNIELNNSVDTSILGTYTVTYNVKDAAGNQSETLIRTVHVVLPPDENAPTITLNGDSTLYLTVGQPYMELGAEADDDRDGNITEQIIIDMSQVNTNTSGKYLVTYNVTDAAGNNAVEVKRTIIVEENQIENIIVSGKITDTNGSAILGAIVTIDGKTTTTDSNGSYTIANVRKSERIKVNCMHSNYLDNSRILTPSNRNILDLKLATPNVKLNFISSEGVKLSDNGASLELPENAYVDENGNNYIGNIHVMMSYNPIKTFVGNETIPGNFEAYDENKTFIIQSYGFMSVQLSDDNGNKLNLNSNKTATLIFPKVKTTTSPSSLPLWYYNKEQGYWIEDGNVELVDLSYIGKVHHFTSWFPAPYTTKTATLKICVEDENGLPMNMVQVNLTQQSKSPYGWLVGSYTDENGIATWENVPADVNLSLYAFSWLKTELGGYEISYSNDYPDNLKLVDKETRDITDCLVIPKLNPDTRPRKKIYVSGTYTQATNCESPYTYEPISYGIISIYDTSNWDIVGQGYTNYNGTFNVSFNGIISSTHNYFAGTRYSGGNSFVVDSTKNQYNLGNIMLPLCY